MLSALRFISGSPWADGSPRDHGRGGFQGEKIFQPGTQAFPPAHTIFDAKSWRHRHATCSQDLFPLARQGNVLLVLSFVTKENLEKQKHVKKTIKSTPAVIVHLRFITKGKQHETKQHCSANNRTTEQYLHTNILLWSGSEI